MTMITRRAVLASAAAAAAVVAAPAIAMTDPIKLAIATYKARKLEMDTDMSMFFPTGGPTADPVWEKIVEDLVTTRPDLFVDFSTNVDKCYARAHKVEYTLELALELKKVQGLDAELELRRLIVNETIAEIDQHVAGKTRFWLPVIPVRAIKMDTFQPVIGFKSIYETSAPS